METKKEQKTVSFPPIVSVLGHVDHGKTSLLDAIRKSSHAASEKGGITQRIGASEIEILHEGNTRRITFIDTPGHEAFTNMRSQGVSAADIVLLVVAADDGIMPQTQESIEKIRESGLPFIVVITKTDVPGAQIEKVKQSLLKAEIMLEGLGGDAPYIGVSSKTGENIEALLDLIVLVYDMSGNKKSENDSFLGVIIDSKLDKRRGVISSLVVKGGKLEVGQSVFKIGKSAGKVKALVNANGKNISFVLPGDACEILGLSEILPAGSLLYTQEMQDLPAKVEESIIPKPPQTLANFFNETDSDVVPVVLKTDTNAEIEAIKASLPKRVKVVFEGQGEIGASDILLAKDFKALVLGFNVNISKEAKQLADADKVFYKTYTIIYELLDEIEVLARVVGEEGLEKIIGKGKIVASFSGTTGEILGVKVEEGRLARGDRIKIMRKEQEIGRSQIVSLKKGKEDMKVAEKNTECGIMISPKVDFAVSDMVLSINSK